MYQGEYGLVGSEMSLFTRKLEAQLRYQRIPWYWHFKTMERAAEIEARAGTHFIPVLITPEKWMIHDTIALGPLLDQRFPERGVIPHSPVQRACCFVLEDMFNHWLGRSCIHTRWCYPDTVDWVGPRFGANNVLNRSIEELLSDKELQEFAGIGPMMYENFGKLVCEYNGVGPDQSEAVRGDFGRMLDVLANHFAQYNFLLGDRPCLADFALAGASKAHYINDPEPLGWLGEHREMLQSFTQRCFEGAAEIDGDWLPDDQVSKTLVAVIEYATDTYFRFASANIAAGHAGDKYYEYDYGYGPTKARTQKRLDFARRHVGDELARLGAAHDESLQALFGGRGILQHYLS